MDHLEEQGNDFWKETLLLALWAPQADISQLISPKQSRWEKKAKTGKRKKKNWIFIWGMNCPFKGLVKIVLLLWLKLFSHAHMEKNGNCTGFMNTNLLMLITCGSCYLVKVCLTASSGEHNLFRTLIALNLISQKTQKNWNLMLLSSTVIFDCIAIFRPAGGTKEPHLLQPWFAETFGTIPPPSKHYYSPQPNPAELQQHSAHEYQASVSDKPPLHDTKSQKPEWVAASTIAVGCFSTAHI